MSSDPPKIVVEVPQAKLLRAFNLAMDAHRPVQRRGHAHVTCLGCCRPWPCPAEQAAQDLPAHALAERSRT